MADLGQKQNSKQLITIYRKISHELKQFIADAPNTKIMKQNNLRHPCLDCPVVFGLNYLRVGTTVATNKGGLNHEHYGG